MKRLDIHSNFNDLKTKKMEYKELVKHHTQVIKDKNDNKWEVIETSDLEEICETYYQHKLKLLGIDGVVISFPMRERIGFIYNAVKKATEKRKEQGFKMTHKKRQMYEMGFEDAVEWMLGNENT